MNKKYLLATGVVLIAAAAAFAISAEKEEAKEEATEAASAEAGDTEYPTFRIELNNHKFTPDRVEIPAGKKVKLIVRNNDDSMEEFESEKLNREKMVMAKKEITVFVGPVEAGEYPFEGELNPKTARGVIIAK